MKILSLIFLLCSSWAFSANHFVRPGASGKNTGVDWTNAYSNFPANLVRGDTYYLAGGSYGDTTFNDAISGASLITIVKATATQHGGVETGWQDSYGTTQAIFASLTFSKGNYLFDGATGGGPGNWETGFGFKVQITGSGQAAGVYFGANVSNITFQHVDFQGRGRAFTGGDTDLFYVVNPYTNLKISRCFLHDTDRTMILSWPAGGSGFTVEYSKFARNGIAEHREAWSAGTDSNVVVQNNLFEDIMGTGFIAIVNNSGDATNWDISGNVFYWTGKYTDGIINTGVIMNRYDGTCGGSAVCVRAVNWRIYNNVIANIAAGSFTSAIAPESAVNYVVENNIWYGNKTGSSGVSGATTADYNWFYGNTKNNTSGAHDLVGTATPFVDAEPWLTGNWSLKTALPGVALTSPYNTTDFLGNVRGNDGVWDRGAIEFGGKPLNLSAPKNVRVIN